MTSQAQLTLLLYPFGAGAAGVNLFFASLISSWLGLPVISPWSAVLVGALLGVPITWVFAGHIRHLMEEAETRT